MTTDPHRRLVVLRHAKSSWPDGVPDVRRPLAGRGLRDAPAVGRWLREHLDGVAESGAPHIDTGVGGADVRSAGGAPIYIVCSPAVRARETWELVAGPLGVAARARFDDRVYDASVGDLLDVVHDLPPDATTALLIGHNPGLAALVALLGGEDRTMATSAIAVLSWRGRWTDAAARCAVLDAHATPRG